MVSALISVGGMSSLQGSGDLRRTQGGLHGKTPACKCTGKWCEHLAEDTSNSSTRMCSGSQLWRERGGRGEDLTCLDSVLTRSGNSERAVWLRRPSGYAESPWRPPPRLVASSGWPISTTQTLETCVPAADPLPAPFRAALTNACKIAALRPASITMARATR